MSLDQAQKLEEADWVTRASTGDRDAFRLLVERYQSRAMALAFEILRNRSDAEDVVQESFVKAFFALKDFERNSSFYTWLYRIVHNMAIDYRRKIQRRGKNEIDISRQSVDGESQELQIAGPASLEPERQVSANQEIQRLDRAFQALPLDSREVLRLRELEGCSYKQIARILKITPGTVMSRLFYARKKLQDLMLPKDDSDSSSGQDLDINNVGSRKLKLTGSLTR